MIKPPSQQFEYTLIFSGDPSLNVPSLEALEALPEPEREKAIAAREKALDVARETGQWAPLINAGETPTMFHVRPISGALLDWLHGEIRRGDLSSVESAVLALRLALRKVEGFGGQKVAFEIHNGQQLVTMAMIDALYAVDGVGRKIVQELGGLVLLRAFEGLRPKS